MDILGLDNGYNFTKTSEEVKFLSSIRKGHDVYNDDTLEIEVDGVNYIIGEKDGTFIADGDKLKTKEGKLNLQITTLAAIALSFKDKDIIDVTPVVGTPVAYYEDQRDPLYNIIKELDGKAVCINKLDKKQIIKIKDVLVFPQSAGVVFKKRLGKENSLVIDIGGGTWDVSQFEGYKLVKKATYPEGMLILYSNIAQYLNNKYYTNYDSSDIYDLIHRDFFSVEGEKKSMKEVEPIIREHTLKVLTKIKRDFDINGVDNRIAIGGGAEEVKDILIEEIKNIEIEKRADFTNAETFKFIGTLQLQN